MMHAWQDGGSIEGVISAAGIWVRMTLTGHEGKIDALHNSFPLAATVLCLVLL
jgi:hypothetical protein